VIECVLMAGSGVSGGRRWREAQRRPIKNCIVMARRVARAMLVIVYFLLAAWIAE